MNFLDADGRLILAEWAELFNGALLVDITPKPSPMYGTTATAKSLVSNGQLGVDLIRVPAGGGFAPHVHPGDHLLICVAGEGTITYDGIIYPTQAGQVYLVEGQVAHAVGAITDHCILAVGSPHRPAHAADRMLLTDYAAVSAEMGQLNCLACGIVDQPDRLRRQGCVHLPVASPDGKLLIVGICPPSPDHELLPAFVKTRSGGRLAALLDVDPDALLERADTVNVFSEHLEDWQEASDEDWKQATERIRPTLAGRVVVACGKQVARWLAPSCRSRSWGHVELIDIGDDPALMLTIPHPSGLARAWNDPRTVEGARRTLTVAASLAAAGSPLGAWQERDVDALQSISLPALAHL